METSKKELEEVGAVIFGQAESITKTINNYGLGLINCKDDEHQFIIFKTKKDVVSRFGDVFMVDVPGIDDKYKERGEDNETEQDDEVRSV